MNLYQIGKILLTPAIRLAFHLRVFGTQNIPESGGFVLCCNHRSVYDPCILAAACERPIRFMAKSELFEDHGPLAKHLLLALGAFSVRRDSGDAEAVKMAVSITQQEEVLGIFPQGKCIRDNSPFEPKAGAVLIARKAGVPIVPACIYCEGPLRLFRRVTVRFGSPVSFSQVSRDGARASLKAASQKIAQQVNLLLEEKY